MKNIIRFLKNSHYKNDNHYGKDKAFSIMITLSRIMGLCKRIWIPAFAGMTSLTGMMSLTGMKNFARRKMLVGMVYVILAGGSFSTSAQYLAYDPVNFPEAPYIYKDSWHTKRNIQFVLLLMTDEPEEFKRVFDYFAQFGPSIALDINYRSRDEFKSSYLTRATALRHWKIVQYLINKGINIDWQDSYGTTALINASGCGHLPAVRSLLDSHADKTIVDEDGDNAVSAARKGQQDELHCPEGEYDRVIALLEGVHEEQQVTEVHDNQFSNDLPGESNLNNPKYGAIAHKTDNPLIFVWNLGYSSRDEARNDVVRKCNNINAQGRETEFSSCEFLVSFPTGRCVAYMVSSQEDEEALYESEGHHIIMAWGVGSSKRQAMDEALRKCDRPALKNECKVLISECQY